GLVEAHARYLTANPERQVVLQGNTDERGAREYNLALGQKRAEAVRRAMAVLGVSDNQVEAVSFGEERPRNFGSSEADMAENRRVDIVYK
ncbi:MAG: OmpA family protein, partial [Burkholderiaceae bacterium]